MPSGGTSDPSPYPVERHRPGLYSSWRQLERHQAAGMVACRRPAALVCGFVKWLREAPNRRRPGVNDRASGHLVVTPGTPKRRLTELVLGVWV